VSHIDPSPLQPVCSEQPYISVKIEQGADAIAVATDASAGPTGVVTTDVTLHIALSIGVGVSGSGVSNVGGQAS